MTCEQVEKAISAGIEAYVRDRDYWQHRCEALDAQFVKTRAAASDLLEAVQEHQDMCGELEKLCDAVRDALCNGTPTKKKEST